MKAKLSNLVLALGLGLDSIGGSENSRFNIIVNDTPQDRYAVKDEKKEQFYSKPLEKIPTACIVEEFNGKLTPLYKVDHILNGKDNFRNFYTSLK